MDGGTERIRKVVRDQKLMIKWNDCTEVKPLKVYRGT